LGNKLGFGLCPKFRALILLDDSFLELNPKDLFYHRQAGKLDIYEKGK